MTSATAVIKIIGIFLMSYSISPGRLIAVAPRIPCHASDVALRGDTAEKAMNEAGIEEHEAILIFPEADYRSSNGFDLQPFSEGYKYVKLDGEVIRFITTSRTRNTAIAAGTKKAADAEPSTELALPHIECCARPELRPEYLPKTNYRLAAAVLDFPRGAGNVCVHVQEMGRRDTVVDLVNDGTLIVEATKGKERKRITFAGTVELMFEHVPPDETGGTPCPGTHNHYLAYGAMIRPCKNPGNCTGSTLPLCEKNLGGIGISASIRTDALCSNNQWP